jgi:glycosyltransferase involved in cell wall biosynthesis
VSGDIVPAPLVSVVLPVYNGERYLAAALASIFDQEYRHFEIVVVDDGSTDASADIAKSMPGVRYLYQHNQGVAAAWNAGIAAAKADLIAFLAQDDLWARNKLAIQVAYLNDCPGIQYCISHARSFLEPGCGVPPGLRPELLERGHVGVMVETMLARVSAFDLVGRFDTSLVFADADWFARAKDAGVPMAVLPQVLLYRRVHNDNLTYRAIVEGQRDLLKTVARSIKRQRSTRTGEDGGIDRGRSWD